VTAPLTKLARVRNDGRWRSRGANWATPPELYALLDAEFHFTVEPDPHTTDAPQ